MAATFCIFMLQISPWVQSQHGEWEEEKDKTNMIIIGIIDDFRLLLLLRLLLMLFIRYFFTFTHIT